MRKTLLFLLLMLALGAPALAADAASDAKPEARKPPVHKITQSVSYVMIDPIYTTIMDSDRPVGLLMVGIGLDIPNSELRDNAVTNMPALRDGYVRALMAFTATSVRYWRQPDVAEIADRLQQVTDRMLRRPGAKLLLAQVAIRLKK
ncbi:MAG TPA: hypothetical protein VMU01_09980 [Rhizomicrobium sp.]|nr:hypothetical protein [Rhizomicrobium sp.]